MCHSDFIFFVSLYMSLISFIVPSISNASCILFHPYIQCTPWFHWLQDSCYIRFQTLLKSSSVFHCLKNNFNCSVCFELHTQLTLFSVPAGYSPCLSLISQSFPLNRYLNENFLLLGHVSHSFKIFTVYLFCPVIVYLVTLCSDHKFPNNFVCLLSDMLLLI